MVLNETTIASFSNLKSPTSDLPPQLDVYPVETGTATGISTPAIVAGNGPRLNATKPATTVTLSQATRNTEPVTTNRVAPSPEEVIIDEPGPSSSTDDGSMQPNLVDLQEKMLVRFAPLPFYDILNVLVNPTLLRENTQRLLIFLNARPSLVSRCHLSEFHVPKSPGQFFHQPAAGYGDPVNEFSRWNP